VPDLYEARTDLRNNGFETGTGTTPAGWAFRGRDEHHTLTWERGGARNGDRCVCMAAVPGSAPSWFTAAQTGIRVSAGGQYTLRG
jgi:hypothetical protein